jgi:coproporphyrinogen III oxidase-like Fe-S oxidoreductase
MCLAYFPAIKVQIWPLFSKRWLSAGIVSHTGCLMLNTSEYHKEGVESLLSDVLETQGDHLKKYSLSPKAALGILRRSSKGKGQLPNQLQKALEDVVGQEQAGAK